MCDSNKSGCDLFRQRMAGKYIRGDCEWGLCDIWQWDIKCDMQPMQCRNIQCRWRRNILQCMYRSDKV